MAHPIPPGAVHPALHQIVSAVVFKTGGVPFAGRGRSGGKSGQLAAITGKVLPPAGKRILQTLVGSA